MNLPCPLWLPCCLLLAACKPGLNSADNQDLAANLSAPFDYYINGMRTERFGADGKATLHLSATRATHFAADDHVELTSPVLYSFGVSAQPWIISSNSGNLHHNAGTEEFTLTGLVKAQTTMPKAGATLLETSRLNILPKDKLAVTDADVTISSQDSHWQSQGLRINLASNAITLLKNVRGSYVP